MRVGEVWLQILSTYIQCNCMYSCIIYLVISLVQVFNTWRSSFVRDQRVISPAIEKQISSPPCIRTYGLWHHIQSDITFNGFKHTKVSTSQNYPPPFLMCWTVSSNACQSNIWAWFSFFALVASALPLSLKSCLPITILSKPWSICTCKLPSQAGWGLCNKHICEWGHRLSAFVGLCTWITLPLY